jgi:dTDP-glucose 4,6-dehydratase
MTKIIVTGATSFIGSKFVEDVLWHTDWELYCLTRLNSRLLPVSSRVHQIYHDLLAEVPSHVVNQVKDATYLVHFAADVSGIKSLSDPRLSVTTNVVGTYNTLELARKLNLEKFVHISTGEAVGSAPFPFFLDEKAPLRPSNPYAASKAAAEVLVNSYRVSFAVPAIIVRSMNVFGPGQSTDRFVPAVVRDLIRGNKIKCHVDRLGNSGSRCWLHVDVFSSVLLQNVLEDGLVGETYHVVGPERNNWSVIDLLARALHLDYTVENVVPGPSHDLRYALKDTKFGYDFSAGLDEALASTARSLSSGVLV